MTRLAVALLVPALAASSCGCGYELARGETSQRMRVELGALKSPDAATAQAELAGARDELARAGALADGVEDVPVLRVDLVSVEERAEGVVAVAGSPQARGVRVVVVGRARLVRGGAVERDTGDARAVEVVSAAPTGDLGLAASRGAEDAAARRLGASLTRRILGFPEPSEP
jgi:hypothetical protein